MAAGGDYRSANADRRGGNDPDVLHKQLSMAMIEKDQLEQEFWRLGNQSKTKQEIQRKRELEVALERSNQGIQLVKNRLKDLNASNR